MKPLDYARAACETMMRRYDAPLLPPVGRFHYHQGVMLSGLQRTGELLGDDRYLAYVRRWVDAVFDLEGNIRHYTHGNLDDIQPGILLYPLLDATGDAYYARCLASVRQEVADIPVNAEGGYWHKVGLKDQMWLDGLYMAGPFCAEYGRRFGDRALLENVVHQALLMRQKTFDEETGLLHHAWDGSGEAPWADPESGCSGEFWGRSMGWVPVALLDDLEHLPEDLPGRDAVARMCVQLLEALCRYQSEDGRWYQVVNKGGCAGNWLENSCSCLYVAALCRAMRRGLMPASYGEAARRGYEGVIRSLRWGGEDLLIGNVCIGTGVGDYQFYCDRPTSVNDLHGVGAFLLMCTEMHRWLDECADKEE